MKTLSFRHRSGLLILGLYLLTAAITGLTNWAGWIQDSKTNPVDIQALYRFGEGDIEYYPMIKGLSHGNLGEAAAKESMHHGIISFPFYHLLPHAFLVHVFGNYGWLIADLLYCALQFVAIFMLLRVFEISLGWALLCALFSVLNPTEPIAQIFNSGFSGNFRWLVQFIHWDRRIPRGFITQSLTLLAMSAILTLFGRTKTFDRKRAIRSFFTGAIFTIASLVDIYVLLPLITLVGANTLRVFQQHRLTRNTLAKYAAAFALGCGVLAVPFVAQRLLESPDVPVRFGKMVLQQLPRIEHRWLLNAALVFVLILGVYGAKRAFFQGKKQADTWMAKFLCVGAMAAVASLGGFLFPLLTHTSIQLYHFAKEFEFFGGLLVFLAVVFFLNQGWQRVESNFPQVALAVLVIFPLCVMSETGRIVVHRAEWTAHLRTDHFEYVQLGFHYRPDLTDLSRELQRPKYHSCAVLATWDLGLAMWWNAFLDRNLFAVDPNASTLPDSEIEKRFLEFAKISGITEAGLDDFLRFGATTKENENEREGGSHNNAAVVYFMTGNRDTFTPTGHRRPLSDYDDSHVEKLRSLSSSSSWFLSVPKSDRARLTSLFKGLSLSPTYDLDLVALLKGGNWDKMHVLPGQFELVYENATFRVYQYRKSHCVQGANS